MYTIKMLSIYLQRILSSYRNKIRCIYVAAFFIGLLGYMLHRYLWSMASHVQLPDLHAVIRTLAQEEDNECCLYDLEQGWKHPDFITIYTHSNDYIEEVLKFLNEPGHTTKEHLILQDMMELLSAKNYALFLEACGQAYLEKKMTPRMLIEMTRPIRWQMVTREISWRPGYFLTHYNKPEVQAILARIKQNIALPIYFKKCIADVATGKAYKQVVDDLSYSSTYRPIFFIE